MKVENQKIGKVENREVEQFKKKIGKKVHSLKKKQKDPKYE